MSPAADRQGPAAADRQGLVVHRLRCSLRQLESAYREALYSPDVQVARLGLELIWQWLEEALAEGR
jgi:hypothetical protein